MPNNQNKNLFINSIVFLISVILPLLLIYIMAYRVPFGDSWDDNIRIYFAYLQHQLSWQTFFTPHNEHRLILTRLIFLAKDIFLTSSHRAINVCSYLLFLATFLFVSIKYKQSRVALRFNEYTNTFIFLLFSAILFFPKDIAFWSWSYIIQFPLTIFFVITAIFALSKKNMNGLQFIVGLMLSFLATASSANGLMMWPIGFLLLLLYRADFFKIACYFIIGLVTIYCYSHNNHLQGYILNHPVRSFLYFTNFFGNWSTQILAPIIGLGAVVLYVLALYRISLKTDVEKKYILYPWLAIGLFAIANGFLASLTRIEFGVRQSLSTRYACISLMLCLSLTGCYGLLWSTLSKKYKNVLKSSIVIFAISFLGFYHEVWQRLAARYHFSSQEIALPYRVILPADNSIYPPGNHVIAKRLAVFRDSKIYHSGNPIPNYLNKIISSDQQKKIGAVLDTKNYSIQLGKAPTTNDSGLITGTALTGYLMIQKRQSDLSHALLLLNENNQVIGIAFAAMPFLHMYHYSIRFDGFVVDHQIVTRVLQLNNQNKIHQLRTRLW